MGLRVRIFISAFQIIGVLRLGRCSVEKHLREDSFKVPRSRTGTMESC